jgi:hypothetical protein
MSWFSIYISQSNEANPIFREANAIFRGYFKVVDSIVTEFYQGTNFNSNILVGVGEQRIPNTPTANLINPSGKNTNTFENYYFTSGGTLINVVDVSVDYYWFGSGKIGLHSTPAPSTLLGQPPNFDQYLTFIQSEYNYHPPYSTYQSQYMYYTQSISDPTCFNEGTKILCLNKKFEEEYIPIENLRKGDLVKSYKHGYRKIDLIGKNPMINNPEKFNECMYKMEKTKENDLIEDLIITGGHAILVDDLGDNKEENDKIFGGTQMIDDKYLLLSCVSKDFKKLENKNLYIYYHFILENNGNNEERYGVWANGVLTETPNKNFFMGQKFNLL